MLLLDNARLQERKDAAGNALAALADSIAADLEIVMSRPLYVPEEKALLSRAGGRCEDDGTQLEFDPYSPQEHRCPQCGRVYTGLLHHRWWISWYQLWLAERGVNAALLFLLKGDARHGQFARELSLRYCELYAAYPNRDNVLGPTRLFFSTYLESIWLLQLCVMADLLECAGDSSAANAVREKIARPSAALIAQYDEGMSNRQVWNNAALMAAALLIGDRAAAERVVHAPSGVEAHLAEGLLDDGTWYEGENYHLFAHRGLWYCVVLAETAGIAIDAKVKARFQEGFAAPFATALPDFTLPSRKDSQYAISLRQPRFAELCELGLARAEDERLVNALARLYATDIPRGDTNRARSTADVERNLPATSLTRADLGWRSLLHARATLPPLERLAPKSAHLAGQGVSVFRRDGGEVYVALDWGQSGGGHGHPDRLNILFMHGKARWLDDLGTGSYVDPSLHWYRSTLAHNAPLIDGRSQILVNGRLLAHDERGGVGWAFGAVEGIAPGVRVTRAVIVTPDYFIDEVRWTSDTPVQFDLPIHFDGDITGLDFDSDAQLDGRSGLEDGFDFIRTAGAGNAVAGHRVALTGRRDGREARVFVCAEGATRWFRAEALGQPSRETRTFHVVRCDGSGGVIRSVYAWSSRVDGVSFDGEKIDVSLGDERHEHWQTDEHWQMELSVGGAHSGIELTGWTGIDAAGVDAAMPRTRPEDTRWREPRDAMRLGSSTQLSLELGEESYRRSEESWESAGRPRARVTVSADADELVVDVTVSATELVFVPANATNPYDNDPVDINGHGVQLYLQTQTDGGAWIMVPEAASSAVRVTPIEGWGTLFVRDASWTRTAAGFSLRASVSLPQSVATRNEKAYAVSIDVLVNESIPGRERRRGQLVLSGAVGEYVYVRGVDHQRSRLVPLVIVD